ncbi:MAG TPA: prepilin-type N-terminal cleavage/methylation domain-containing protein [Longimicrobiales bacterium]|nr:prepilin-type N-terminal cleavage/methylation domain-containing protein [Longimicrobiales bacterium]
MNDRNGFTLVELLVIMVIVGILAAIALPRYASTRERAYVSSMKADLRNLSSKQEIYHSESSTYTQDATALGLRTSEGVTVVIGEAETSGWSALATHESTPIECALYYGDATQVAPAVEAGVVGCTQ